MKLPANNPIQPPIKKVTPINPASLEPLTQQLGKQASSGFDFSYDELGGSDVTGTAYAQRGDCGISVKTPVLFRNRRLWIGIYGNPLVNGNFLRGQLKCMRNNSNVGTLPISWAANGNQIAVGNSRMLPCICSSLQNQYQNISSGYGGTLGSTLCPNALFISAGVNTDFLGWDYLSPFNFKASFDEIRVSVDDFFGITNFRIFVACLSWSDKSVE